MQCVSLWLSDIASVPHRQVGWSEAEGADMVLSVELWVLPRFRMGRENAALSLVSLQPHQKQMGWICVWRRLARELRGYPWDLQGCFPKIASEIHYEQLTKAVYKQLTSAISCLLFPLLLSGEYMRLWYRITGFTACWLCLPCVVLLCFLAFFFFILMKHLNICDQTV